MTIPPALLAHTNGKPTTPNCLSDAAILSFVLDLPDHVPPDFWSAGDFGFNDADLDGAMDAIKMHREQTDGLVPTREVLIDILAANFRIDVDQDRDRWTNLLKAIKRESDPRETPHIKNRLAGWAKERAAKNAANLIDKKIEEIAAAEDPATILKALHELQGVLIGENNEERTRYSFRELATRYPKLRPVVIDGLLRESEVANIISYSKIGKSWLVYGLALSVMTGRPWFGKFPTSKGKVLLVDNELHRETITFRIHKVAEAMGIRFEEYADQLEVWALRGKGKTISTLRSDFMAVEPKEFKLIVLDAKYRFVEAENENDNVGDTRFYNLVNEYGEHTMSAFVMIHHASKGDQSDKRITDVGAGGGAQSRAADSHLVLRELGADGAIALDAAIRSFAPIERLGLRWEFPLWVADATLDTTLATSQNKRTSSNDEIGKAQIMKLLADEGKATLKQIRRITGMGAERAGKLIYQLEQAGEIESKATTVSGNDCKEYVVRRGGPSEQTT